MEGDAADDRRKRLKAIRDGAAAAEAEGGEKERGQGQARAVAGGRPTSSLSSLSLTAQSPFLPHPQHIRRPHAQA